MSIILLSCTHTLAWLCSAFVSFWNINHSQLSTWQGKDAEHEALHTPHTVTLTRKLTSHGHIHVHMHISNRRAQTYCTPHCSLSPVLSLSRLGICECEGPSCLRDSDNRRRILEVSVFFDPNPMRPQTFSFSSLYPNTVFSLSVMNHKSYADMNTCCWN